MPTPETMLINRNMDHGAVDPDKFGAPLALLEIVLAGYVTGAAPAGEVISTTVDPVAGHLIDIMASQPTPTPGPVDTGWVVDLILGNNTVPRDGLYECEIDLAGALEAAGLQALAIEMLVNGAPVTVTPLKTATTSSNVASSGACAKQTVWLVRSDIITFAVTGAGTYTIDATLRCAMCADRIVNPSAPAGQI